MKKGQIIRRKVRNGTPIGPYLRIKGFEQKTVLTEPQLVCNKYALACNSISRDYVYELKTVKLIVPDEIIERIISGRQIAIIHDVSARWCISNLNCAEIVQLRSQKYTNKVIICTVDCVSTVYYNRKPQVRLQLGYIIKFKDEQK